MPSKNKWILGIIVFATLIASLGILPLNISVLFTRQASVPNFFKENRDQRAMSRNAWYLERLADPLTGKIPRNIRQKELSFKLKISEEIVQKGGFFKTIRSSETINPVEFDHRGPYNVGGRTRAIAIDIDNPNNYLAGGASGGLYRSTNSGQSWIKETGPEQVLAITCIAQDRRQSKRNNWYFGTGEAYGASASGGGAYYLGNGIYKSTDSGKTWLSLQATATNTPHEFESFWDLNWNIATDPSNDSLDILYAAVLGGIMRSEDGGDSWTKVHGGSTSSFSYFTDVLVTDSGVVYATLSSDGPATKNGIWRSEDGLNWVNIMDSSWPAIYDRIVMGLNPLNQNEVYFLSVTPNAGKECFAWDGESEWVSLWRYNYLNGDGSGAGGLWTDLSLNIPTGPYTFDDFSPQGGYNLLVKVKPDTSGDVYIGGTNLYESTDGFTTSNNTRLIGGYKENAELPFFVLYPNQHPDQHDLVFDPNNAQKFIAATDGGLYRSVGDSAGKLQWESLNKGYNTTQFYTLAINEQNTTDQIMGGLQDNGTHYINEQNPEGDWVMSFTYDGAYCAIPSHGQFVIMSAQSGKIIKATLDANKEIESWVRIDPTGGHDYQFVAPFVLDPNNEDRMYLAAGRQLYRNNSLSSIPFTNNFNTISSGWGVFSDSLLGSDVSISALAVSQFPPNIVYVGANKKRVYKIENADQGDPSWEEITGWLPTIFPSQGYVNCIAVDPDDADHIFVVFSNYKTYSIYRSIDGGENWMKIAGNLESNPAGTIEGPSCRWLEILPLEDKKAYVLGTSTGLFYTLELDSINTIWHPLAENSVGNNVVEMIRYRETDGLLAVATHGNGVYTTHIKHSADFTIIKDQIPNPELVVYPNPANNFVEIKGLSGFNNPQIQLYSISGGQIEIPYIEGSGESRLSLKAIPTGIYLLKITGAKLSYTQKLIVQ